MLPKFFVCTPGPMGGCYIVFVGMTRKACEEFIRLRNEKKAGDEFAIYQQV